MINFYTHFFKVLKYESPAQSFANIDCGVFAVSLVESQTLSLYYPYPTSKQSQKCKDHSIWNSFMCTTNKARIIFSCGPSFHSHNPSLDLRNPGSLPNDQTAEYGKCTPEIFFVKSNCTPEKGRGTLEFGCGSIVEAFILPQ